MEYANIQLGPAGTVMFTILVEIFHIRRGNGMAIQVAVDNIRSRECSEHVLVKTNTSRKS
jgi:hypothetical protein